MKNRFTEAEELEYCEIMRERRLEREHQEREDALDLIDEGGDDDTE
jgi:hypothetical protein